MRPVREGNRTPSVRRRLEPAISPLRRVGSRRPATCSRRDRARPRTREVASGLPGRTPRQRSGGRHSRWVWAVDRDQPGARGPLRGRRRRFPF